MDKFFNDIHKCLSEMPPSSLDRAVSFIRDSRRVILIGNGGSAAIASHIAVDYTKNAGKEAVAFNDASLLTCLSNDYGYEHLFEQALLFYSKPGDVLIAISSSGKSLSILNAIAIAYKAQIPVITLSGFKPDNPLRILGDVNIYIDSMDYGVVEISHLSVLHSFVGKLSPTLKLVS